ncbi:MAG: cell division protein SepF [Ruminococcaceae bacterium]|nr:cell division protein SepF [Oscillospiraceae bacterium]
MAIFDKIKGFVNPDSINESYDDGYDYIDEEGDIQGSYNDPSYQSQSFQSVSAGSGMSLNGNSLELKVIRPDRFESVSQIADHLLNKRTVVLNLEATNKETSRRIIDFLSGVAYSISGNLKRVANNTFVITPCNVDVSNDVQEAQKAQPKAQTADIYDNI